MDKFTTKEIEQRIDQYQQRIETLQDIIKDIKDSRAKTTLQSHIASYKQTVDELRKELSRRHKR